MVWKHLGMLPGCKFHPEKLGVCGGGEDRGSIIPGGLSDAPGRQRPTGWDPGRQSCRSCAAFHLNDNPQVSTDI